MTIAIDTPYPMRREGLTHPVSQNLSCEPANATAMPPACGARTRSGAPCRALAMRNGRCRMHGGCSTGRKTAAGIASHRAAVTIHGGRSREMIEFRRRMRELQANARRMIEMA